MSLLGSSLLWPCMLLLLHHLLWVLLWWLHHLLWVLLRHHLLWALELVRVHVHVRRRHTNRLHKRVLWHHKLLRIAHWWHGVLLHVGVHDDEML